MIWTKFISGCFLFCLLHALVWFSTNLQFVKGFENSRTLLYAMCLAVPTTVIAYFATKLTYSSLEDSLWAVRFVGFGTSYLVFPVLTWAFLGESMFTAKTLVCVFLSLLIVFIQVFY